MNKEMEKSKKTKYTIIVCIVLVLMILGNIFRIVQETQHSLDTPYNMVSDTIVIATRK
jgi:hypothetical protein